jgi:pimeloyl-ACP methyl ester carboxylesterase
MPAPRLVLVHGTRLSHTQWAPYAGEFPDYDVVMPDLPGHGTAVGQRFSSHAALEVIGAAVEGGEPGTLVVLVGHSLGGYMAMAYAAQSPRRLAGLVLMGASAVPLGLGAAAYRGFARLLDRVGHDRMARVSDRVIARLTSPEVLTALLEGGASYEATADAWETVMAECRPEMLREVACPVLLVNGQFDQLGIHARRFAGACHDARVVVVPRATHLLPLTHPSLVAGILREFVDEVATAGHAGPPPRT